MQVCTFSFSELLTWIKGRLDCIWKAWKVNEVDWRPSPSIPNVLRQTTTSLLAQVKKESSPTRSRSSIRTVELSQLATVATASYECIWDAIVVLLRRPFLAIGDVTHIFGKWASTNL